MRRNQNPKTLIIRADTSTTIGMGHVVRCFALAQYWLECNGGKVLFATAGLPRLIRERFHNERIEVIDINSIPGGIDDAALTAENVIKESVEWVVVDGYHFNEHYYHIIRQAGAKLLCIDDYGHLDNYTANLVLNQNITADAKLYKNRDPSTNLLLGVRYAMLRREFREWSEWSRKIPKLAGNVLVTLGGAY